MAKKTMWVRGLLQQHGATAGVAAIAAVFGLAGALVVLDHEHGYTPAPIITNGFPAGDPANVNLALAGARPAFYTTQSTGLNRGVRVLATNAAYVPQTSSQTYPAGQQAPAPIVRGSGSTQNESLQYNTQPPVSSANPGGQYGNPGQNTGDPSAAGQGGYPQDGDYNASTSDNQAYADGNPEEDAGYEALEQTDQAPPPLPEYDQPAAPDDNYLWTPGYWGYNTGYFWVPGAWVAPPFYGALWTPPWWGWNSGRYGFHRGYWGTHIGYYGGINYGYGYVGTGFYGGYWQGRNFFYNRAVTNVNVARVHNVYERNVTINNTNYYGTSRNRTSFNGGPGGIRMQPRPFEVAAMHEAHYAPVRAQIQGRQTAAADRGQFFLQNRGRPAETSYQRPLASNGTIANGPRRSPMNQPQFPQGNPSNGGDRRAAADSSRAAQGGGNPEVNRPGLSNGAGSPRNDMIQQRTGLWNGNANRDTQGQQLGQAVQRIPNATGATQPDAQMQQQRNLQIQQQQALQQQGQQQQVRQQQLQQQDAARQQQRDVQDQQRQQRDTQVGQQRNLQLQQQQQHDAALQQQRDVQNQQQQQRNLQFQQQREASDQMRNQRSQQEQQRLGVEQQQRNVQQQQQQQQRNLQFQQQQQQQQQRMAVEQQRTAQQPMRSQPAPQHIEARPSPQPQGGQPNGGMHGRPH